MFAPRTSRLRNRAATHGPAILLLPELRVDFHIRNDRKRPHQPNFLHNLFPKSLSASELSLNHQSGHPFTPVAEKYEFSPFSAVVNKQAERHTGIPEDLRSWRACNVWFVFDDVLGSSKGGGHHVSFKETPHHCRRLRRHSREIQHVTDHRKDSRGVFLHSAGTAVSYLYTNVGADPEGSGSSLKIRAWRALNFLLYTRTPPRSSRVSW